MLKMFCRTIKMEIEIVFFNKDDRHHGFIIMLYVCYASSVFLMH